jgi:polyhydroxybutyrate depolymerase
MIAFSGAATSHVVGLAFLVCATTSALAETSVHKLAVGGVERSYILSMPAARRDPRPTIVVLHGGTLNAENAVRTTGVEPLVEREGIVAIYPDAIGGHWYDGRAVARFQWRSEAAGDVAFVRMLVASLVQAGVADPHRVYVTGPSNGGMMTFRLVCEAADLFAAAAPIIANLPADLAPSCKPARAIPTLVMNGTADPLVPYNGGEVGFRGERGRVLSTDETMKWLRKVNGCADTPKVE